jgi:hypothetical protein
VARTQPHKHNQYEMVKASTQNDNRDHLYVVYIVVNTGAAAAQLQAPRHARSSKNQSGASLVGIGYICMLYYSKRYGRSRA